MNIVAEGVETQPQLDWRREHACNEIQGFFYSRPLCAAKLALLHRRHHTPTAALAVV